MKLLVFLFWGVFFAGSASAATPGDFCSPVDLRAALGPPRDQNGTSWCYANSAAELMTQALGRRVSAFDIATSDLLENENALKRTSAPELQKYLRANPDFFTWLEETRNEPENLKPEKILTDEGLIDIGGEESQAVLLSQARGLCLDSKIPDGEPNNASHLSSIQRFAQEHPVWRLPSEGPISRLPERSAHQAAAFQAWVDQRCGLRLPPTKPLIPEDFRLADSADDFYEKIKSREIDPAAARRELFRRIDLVLNEGKAVAFGYDAGDLSGRSPKDEAVGHSSIIAARRMRGGVCHYFVRHHLGRDCDWDPALAPLCEKEQGGIWVPASRLPSMYAILWLK